MNLLMTSVVQEYHLPPTLFPDTDGTSDDSWAHDLGLANQSRSSLLHQWLSQGWLYNTPLQWGSTVNQPSTFAWDTGQESSFLLTGLETVRLWVWSFWQPVCLPQKQTEGDEVSCDALIWGSTSSHTCTRLFLDLFSFKSWYIYSFFGLSQFEPFLFYNWKSSD